jgi:hypothetical protein
MHIRAWDAFAITVGVLAAIALPLPWAPIGAALVAIVVLVVARLVENNR